MSSISAADDILAAQLGDLAPERVQHGWPPRELGDRGDASHAPRCRLDRHAHACPLGLEHERPVAAGGGLEGRDSTAGPERDVVDRAERVVAGAEEKGAGAVLARLDHQVGRIVDEDVREAAALAQDRHQARELVHQRVDGADLAPRDLDHEADAARPAARAAVGVAAVRELGERGVEHEARRRARHRRTCASRQHHARCLIVSPDRGHASSNRRRRAKGLPPTVGETRVDLLHLLEDLRDAYPGALEETILTEIVANALDSGASRISMVADPTTATFTAADDGSGMKRRELARYHDVAASTKTRGEGIGFAGVGIKLGLLVCEEVLTETRRGKTHVATRWHLASRHRAPWKWLPPPRSGRRARYRGPPEAAERTLPAGRYGLQRGRAPAELPAAARPDLRRHPGGALPARRLLRGERPPARAAGVGRRRDGGARPRADRGRAGRGARLRDRLPRPLGRERRGPAPAVASYARRSTAIVVAPAGR